MPDDIESLIDAFGMAIVKKDHEALDVLLAPWIGVQAVLDQVQRSINELASEWEIEDGGWPAVFEGSAGQLTYDDLRAPRDFPPGVEIPERVTAENFAGWNSITFMPAEHIEALGFDAYCDAWFAAVQLRDGLHVGSLELIDPD